MQSVVHNGENGKNHKKFWEDWPARNAVSTADWLKAGLVVIFAVILYFAVQSAGWLGGFNVQDRELTLGISFLIGVAASFSSCLAVVGGMVIAFSEKYRPARNVSLASASSRSDAGEERDFFSGAIMPNLKFHIGRVLTFFVLGGLLGLVGGKISLGGNFISVYTIIIAIVMGWLGLSILGFVPPLSSFGIKTPKFLVRHWGRLEDSEHRAAPYLLGGITFFLPCGFTQSMQIFALASGSFWTGSFVMMAFTLGTMPVLLALGMAATWARLEKISFINKAAGILVILFAVYTLNSGLALWNNNKLTNRERISTNEGANISADKNASVSDRAVQKVEMKITNRGFEPSVLQVKNNIPVQFVINGDGATGCTNKIIIPEYNIAKDIGKGENVIEFTPKKLGAISYSCWMGMVRGKIIVE